MQWWAFSLLGGAGGALFETLVVFRWLTEWQQARRGSTGRIKRQPPRLKTYLDLPAHAWLLGCRTMLGAGSAALFGVSGQIDGVYAAIVLGFAAPSILAQLGMIPRVAAAITGESAARPLQARDPVSEVTGAS